MNSININYHATFNKTSGISEAARLNVTALESASISIHKIYYIEKDNVLERENKLQNESKNKTINIYHININDVSKFLINNTISFEPNVYNIAYWAWEFNKIPEEFIPFLNLFNEIWVPSAFCQNIFSNYAFTPVIKIPHPIENIAVSENTLDLNLNNKFVFLSIFDSLSTSERKNTDGLITSFLETFNENKEVVLILKTFNLEKNKRLNKRINELIKSNPSILLINENYSKNQLNQLIDLSNVYISLHRAEGFGLTMAEAMLRNKIVIGTAYSGNLEFMTFNNSFLIDYKLSVLKEDLGIFKAGYEIAEPDLNHAKLVMESVYNNFSNLNTISNNAKSTIESRFSIEKIGSLMFERIAKIENVLIQGKSTNSTNANELIIENTRLNGKIKKLEKNKLIKILKKLKLFVF